MTTQTGSNNKRKRAQQPHKPTSLKDIARHLGLSVATISVVLSEAPAARSIPRETQERIFKAARELDYHPNYFARTLRRSRTFTVGVLLPEISEGYAAAIMGGIEDRLLAGDYLYIFASHRGKPDLMQTYPKLLMSRGAEGLILVNTTVGSQLRVPVVSVAGHDHFDDVTRIHVDNRNAVRLAMEHLARLGHRRIAFFKGHPGSADTEPRWEGICAAAQEFGVEIRPELVVQLRPRGNKPEPSTPEEGYTYARQLLGAGLPFTALFAFNDISALGAMRAFHELGLRVPQELSVVGFDDVQAAAFQNPGLTTVRQPLRAMGELAATKLLERLDKSEIAPEQEITVEAALIVRESTAAAAQNDEQLARARAVLMK